MKREYIYTFALEGVFVLEFSPVIPFYISCLGDSPLFRFFLQLMHLLDQDLKNFFELCKLLQTLDHNPMFCDQTENLYKQILN